MAAAAVREFLIKVIEDPELQGEMIKAMEAENDREAVTALAQSNGYEFTADELWQEIQALQAEFKRRKAAGELTDEELEAIEGGENLFTHVARMTLGGFMSSSFNVCTFRNDSSTLRN